MLHDGLYEQVINKKLEEELNESEKLCQTIKIDSAEASKVLAQYIAEAVEKGLENLKDNGGDITDQVELTNKIIKDIQTSTKEDDFDSLTVANKAE